MGINGRKCWETVVKIPHHKTTVGFVRQVGSDTRPTVHLLILSLYHCIFWYMKIQFWHFSTQQLASKQSNYKVTPGRLSLQLVSQLLTTAQIMQLAPTAKWLTNLPTRRQHDISSVTLRRPAESPSACTTCPSVTQQCFRLSENFWSPTNVVVYITIYKEPTRCNFGSIVY